MRRCSAAAASAPSRRGVVALNAAMKGDGGDDGDGSLLIILPPRLRWATHGPFRVGEMCPEDVLLTKLSFRRCGRPSIAPPASARKLADAGWWVVIAEWEA